MLLLRRQNFLDLLWTTVALIGGALAGAIDFRNAEVQPTVIVIVVFAGLLGLARPKYAWLWAIIIGLSIPAVYLIATALGYQSRGVPEPGWYASLIALIPAFISAYAGALLRKIMT